MLVRFAAAEPAATTDKQSRPTPTCDIIGRVGHDRCCTCQDGAGHLSGRGSGFDVVETGAGGHYLQSFLLDLFVLCGPFRRRHDQDRTEIIEKQ